MTRLIPMLSCLLMLNGCALISKILEPPPPGNVQATSLLGKPLRPATPDPAMLQNLELAKSEYEADLDNVEKLIWFGRRTAYTGDYRGAIVIFSRGIDRFPEDARLYRHRGHRRISVREFQLAIEDLEHAATLVKGTEDQMEPDGLPNALGIPVSSLHTNIWYHLGLASYLQNDLEKSLPAWQAGLEASANDDMRVAMTHWLYMTLRRLGHHQEAQAVLEPITADLHVIENMVYHRLCLLYKGELSAGDLAGRDTGAVMSDAAAYGLGNWYLAEGREDQATAIFEEMVAGETWASFGHIAAEADLARLRSDLP